jgi:hypothetical protein
MELGPNQKKWIAALRSGEYEQGTVWLCKQDKYCCLGVGCELLNIPHNFVDEIKSYGGRTQLAPEELVEQLALRGPSGKPKDDSLSLVALNDRGKSFEEIADIIEKNPENYFKESA